MQRAKNRKSSPLTLVIDTSVYRHDPGRTRGAFQAIYRLARAGELRICVPYVAEGEFVTHQLSDYDEELSKLSRAVRRILPLRLPAELGGLFSNLHEDMERVVGEVRSAVQRNFDAWINETNAVRIPVAPSHGQKITEAYFNGGPPFKKPKSRDDFPDAFIYQAVVDLSAEVEHIFVAVADGNLNEKIGQLPNITVVKTLEEFVSLPDVADRIRRDAASESLEHNLKLLFDAVERAMPTLRMRANNELRAELTGEVVYEDVLLQEENEGSITRIIDIDELHVDSNRSEYYGGDDLSIHFESEITAVISYDVDREDFHEIDEETLAQADVNTLNEDSYRVRITTSLKCTGSFLLQLPEGSTVAKNMTLPMARSAIERSMISISRLDDPVIKYD